MRIRLVLPFFRLKNGDQNGRATDYGTAIVVQLNTIYCQCELTIISCVHAGLLPNHQQQYHMKDSAIDSVQSINSLLIIKHLCGILYYQIPLGLTFSHERV